MKAFVFDTETTGLPVNKSLPLEQHPHVIELFGHIVEDDGTVLKEIEFLCNPGISLPDIITKITKLVDSDLADKAPFAEYFLPLQEILSEADAVVAHNLQFDKYMIDTEAARLEKEMVWPDQKICTIESTMNYTGYKLNLGKLYLHLFKETFEGAHRARADVEALTRCYLKIRKKGDC